MPRIAIVRKDRCNPVGCGGYLCARVCPVNMEDVECIKTDTPDKKPIIDEHLCTGCGICPNRCPFEAIDIVNLPEALDHPIHRYGRNGFHLYKMLTPLFGKVVGVVGRNGIGKSTALKILSGLLVPNLGKDVDADWKAVLEYFKGHESQTFFELVRQGKVKVSFKPQQVELIPKSVKGFVGEVLRRIDERGLFDSVINDLDLGSFLESDISTLSGGELQRFAIAAAVLRKADLYVFDEPTSYLDIKQRIRVSKFIQSLASEKTAVLVVEHDLILLDFMTDLLHIVYGKEGAYGIVSLPKTTRIGMNSYLSGFIREENMRFRSQEITFKPRQEVKRRDVGVLTSWNNLSKSVGSFSLDAGSGEIKRGEVVGVVGENGTGKTTFVKLLAGSLSADSGSSDNVRVSYKPQYLDSDSDELVMSFLGDAVSKFDVQLIRPLELNHLLMKPLNTLSGGELQRVMIARCLSADADLFLLDEPSAYLDIEQRLAFSKVIRNIAEQREVSMLIVDHDLLFLDYLSDRLLVFDGVPARSGRVTGPFALRDGMNLFLRKLDISMRRDPESNRPRINKLGSQLDQEQKRDGTLYY